ncbi:MAG: glycosyltransferase family 2 protein [Opitutales bacterium]|nr:glycosyltransferase family 2 protein [Opitutales bacterium]
MDLNNRVVSIILPIYKSEKYLPKCLDSITRQTYKDLQVICLIDGSPDNSAEICKKYAESDPRIEVVEQKNSGCAAARNNALKAVKGGYVCFVDPDDFINERYVESLYGAISETGADVAAATHIRLRGSSRKFRVKYSGVKKYSDPSGIFRAAKCPPNYNVTNKMYRTRLIRENNILFETGCAWCDDVRFCVKTLLAAKTLATAGGAVYYFVKRSDSISHANASPEKQRQRFKIRSSAVAEMLSRGIKIPQREKVVTKKVYSFFDFPLLKIRVDMQKKREQWLLLGAIPVFFKKANG